MLIHTTADKYLVLHAAWILNKVNNLTYFIKAQSSSRICLHYLILSYHRGGQPKSHLLL